MQVMAKKHFGRYPQNIGICFKKGNPVFPCQNPKIRVAGFLILAKPSLSGARPSLSGAMPSLSGAMPRLSEAKPSPSGAETKFFRSGSQVFQEQKPSFSGAEAKFFRSRSQVFQEQKPSSSGTSLKPAGQTHRPDRLVRKTLNLG